MFDSHRHIKQLQAGGWSEPQAEALVDVMHEMQNSHLTGVAMKEDIVSVRHELAALRSETKSDLRELELRMDGRFKDVQLRLGGMIMALGGVLITVKYFG